MLSVRNDFEEKLALKLMHYRIQMNWQVVPVPPWKCSFRPQLFIVVAVLNILTDAALLSVPIPMLWRLKIPMRKKLIISAILSSGLFVITAAIIRVVYSLDAEPSASNINRWGVRETIIGIFAINVCLQTADDAHAEPHFNLFI